MSLFPSRRASARTIRILWARSGDRCALCRCRLFVDPSDGGTEGGVEERRGSESGSPARTGLIKRINEPPIDRYDNLILLCRPHYRAACEERYSPEYLNKLKADHEEWVRQSLAGEGAGRKNERYDPRYHGVTLLPRIHDGAAFLELLGAGVHSIQYDHEEREGKGEQGLVEEFLRYVKGIVEVWSRYSERERRRVAYHLDGQIEALGRGGVLLFGLRYSTEASIADAVGTWTILRMAILREGV